MSEVESAATELKTQYASQVSADLERNTKEQERIGAEVEALQEQLSALQHDQTLLAELQRALGGDQSAANAKGASVPAPSVPRQATATASGRKKATTAKPAAKPAATKATTKSAPKSAVSKAPAPKSAAAKPAAAKSTASKATASKTGAKSAAAEPGAAKAAAAKPTLVELIREHLGRQSEPRSSAEVATALAEAHPEREIKPKVVRTTVEGLVAKGQVQRSKQGSSVFYTTSKAAPADTATEKAAAPAATA
ncbi:hypothetical protein ACFU96_17345 [Streptomyces sp. NPDC057620]|uniref:hypothetical protein n=1 Tax=Streptomyces sp. NPDC057620 TaxID=3346185 RepID=UPI0036BA38D5